MSQLAGPSVVFPTSPHDGRELHHFPKGSEQSDTKYPIPKDRLFANRNIRRGLLRQKINRLDVSLRTKELLVCAWRPETEKTYNVFLKRWSLFCEKHKLDKFSCDWYFAWDFLVELFHQGYAYSSINTARSALSNILCSENTKFGENEVTVKILKAVYNLRPPLSKYIAFWDISIVLMYLKEFPPVEKCTFKELSLKFLTLFMLVSSQRVQTAFVLKRNRIMFDDDCIVFGLDEPLKMSKAGKALEVIKCKNFPKDKDLCIVHTAKEYLKRSDLFRKTKNQRLFISYVRPFKPVTKNTLARWLKFILWKAGINIVTFQAHSFRGASASMLAALNVSVADILNKGKWSTDCTFRKHYLKPIVEFNDVSTHLLKNVANKCKKRVASKKKNKT